MSFHFPAEIPSLRLGCEDRNSLAKLLMAVDIRMETLPLPFSVGSGLHRCSGRAECCLTTNMWSQGRLQSEICRSRRKVAGQQTQSCGYDREGKAWLRRGRCCIPFPCQSEEVMRHFSHLLRFIWQPTEATTSRAQPGPPLLRLVSYSISKQSLLILLDANLFQIDRVVLAFWSHVSSAQTVRRGSATPRTSSRWSRRGI